MLQPASSLVYVRLKQIPSRPTDILVCSSDLPVAETGSDSSASGRVKQHQRALISRQTTGLWLLIQLLPQFMSTLPLPLTKELRCTLCPLYQTAGPCH